MVWVSRERLAEMLVEVADPPVDDYDVVEFLHRVTTRTAELICVPAVGLQLADARGQPQVVAASDEAARRLERFQVRIREGPCLDAYATRAPVVNPDLRSAGNQWPAFAPRATALGFRSVHSLPLQVRAQVIGTLNMFGTQAGRLEPSDVKIAQAVAGMVTIGLLRRRALHHGEVLIEQLRHALTSRVPIEQAKGALARAHGVGADQAFEMLRRYSRNHNLKLVDVARAVVTDAASVPDLTRPRRPAPARVRMRIAPAADLPARY